MAEENKDSKSKVIIIVLIIVIILLIGGGVTAFLLLSGSGDQEAPTTTDSTVGITTTAANKNPLKLDYDGAAVGLDEDGLEKQIDEMLKNSSGNVSLEYKNEAVSDDGTHFTCYLANSELNTEDMFIAIFTDANMTKQVYLSGLLRPGTSIQEFVSEIDFGSGTHTAVAMFTSVSDDHETMTSQIAVELTLTVH